MQQINSGLRRLSGHLRAISLTLLLLTACSVTAQVAGTGSIQGDIADATGAAIPGARITLTEESTQVKRTAQSDSKGSYAFPNINIGTYSLQVGMPGFETYSKTGNVLEVGSSISIDVKMTVGRASEKVEVHADSLSLQTEDVSFKQTIDQQTVTELPLNGRRMTDLITGAGGAAPAPGGDFTGTKYSYQTVSVSIAGGNGNTTQWRLDGGDNNDYMGNGNLPFPFPDAVAQFSVESTAMGAGSGMHSGGLVNVVTRSGTNMIHGTGFYFTRNPYINATTFYNTKKDGLHQHEYGGTFGAPVIIPKLYNGRDKLFFFVGYQFHQAKQGGANPTTYHIPTAANLAGDFSVTDGATCTANGKFLQLYDPLTGALIPGDKYATTPTWSPQALALQKYLPAIDPTFDPGNCGAVSVLIPSQVFYKQFINRIDYTINPKNNLYGRYFLDGYQAPSFFSPTNILLTPIAPGNYERVQTGTIGENYTINSSTVNSAHVTVTRRVDVRASAPGINACTLGVNIFCAVSTGFQSTITGKFSTYCGTCAPGHYNDNSLSFSDELTMIRGKHQIIVGGEYVRNDLNIVGAYQSNGNFTFSGIYSGSATGTAGAGDANLDLLEGAMSGFQQSKQQQNALRGSIPSLYGQDTYHAIKTLTLIAGIRWSPTFMPVDFFNRGTTFDNTSFLANKVSTVFPGAPAGTFFYGDPGVTRQFTQNSPWQFSPNVGVSLDPFGDGKTVVRAGAELIYDEPNYFTAQRVNQNPPFATSVSPPTTGQLSFARPWTVAGVDYNTFPQPVVPTKTGAVFPAQGQYIVLPPHFHPSYTIQYTASIQRQLGHGWQLQFDYIGNGTRHAPIGYPYDNAVFIPGVWGAGGTGCTGIVTTGPAAVKPGAAGTNCSTTSNATSRYKLTIANPGQGNQYLGGGGGSVLVGDFGTANYNGLITTIQHRLSSTFSLLANWTWSKCLNEADAAGDLAGVSVQNPDNPRADYAPCGSDYRHIENVVVIAKSKFGVNRLTGLLVNNWEIAPKFQILSGAPFNVTSGIDNSLTSNGQDRPNLVPGVPIYQRVAFSKAPGEPAREYLNPAAFAQVTAPCPTPILASTCPTLGTFGTLGRNAFRGIPAYNIDAQISRIFPIHERLALDVRLEAFNVLNHPNFGNPATNLNTGTTFGQVSSITNNPRLFQFSGKVTF
jgi:hypothetical protein